MSSGSGVYRACWDGRPPAACCADLNQTQSGHMLWPVYGEGLQHLNIIADCKGVGPRHYPAAAAAAAEAAAAAVAAAAAAVAATAAAVCIKLRRLLETLKIR